MPRDEFICPVCGAEVPAKALACPECGSDEKTGWSHNTIYDGTDIEDPDDFKYEDWQRKEAGTWTGRHWIKLIVALLALGLFLWLVMQH